METTPLPALRASLNQAAAILGLSRSVICRRINAGELRIQKDGRKIFVATSELRRYCAAQAKRSSAEA